MPTATPIVVQFLDNGTARVEKRSLISGNIHSMILPLTLEQFDAWSLGRGMIQNVLPHLSADQREFLLTGITPEEWDATFKEDKQ